MDGAFLMETAVQYGIFAVLFVSLLVYVEKQNEKREKEYQSTIAKLSDNILRVASENHNVSLDTKCIIKGIEEDIDCISTKIHEVSRDVDNIKTNVESIKKDVTYINGRLEV